MKKIIGGIDVIPTIDSGGKAVWLAVLTFWYWLAIAIINIAWLLVPGLVGSAVVTCFYLATRRSGADYKQRFWGTYGIGILITCALSFYMTSAPTGVCIANGLIMPASVCCCIHAAHRLKK